jgi:hypothetical protein
VTDYPASDGWTLTYSLNGKGAVAAIVASVNADDSNGYSVTVTAATTAAYTAGLYQYLARVSLAGEVYTVDSGVVIIAPNVATAATGALQTHAEKMVALCEAAIEANAVAAASGGTGGAIQSYTIGNRSVTFRDEADLRAQLSHYKWQVWHEKNPGKLGPRRQVRFRG